jgi:Copper type II ascorbate-dependent monooxygenase, C-terminal domain
MYKCSWALLCAASLVLMGCDSDGSDLAVNTAPGSLDSGLGGFAAGPASTFDSGLAPVLPSLDASTPGVIAPAPEAGVAAVPCEVASIISQKCALCHGATPKFNAPMRLMSVADFQGQSPVTKGQPVYRVAAVRVDPPNSAQLMPPPGTVTPLTAAERSTLVQWLAGGAQGSANGCAVSEPPPVGADAGTPMGPAPKSGVSIMPYQGWDKDVQCYKFLAHDGSKRGKYAVGIALDSYTSFSLMPPWQGARYVRAFRAVIDNEQALHHFLLFNAGGPVSDGSIAVGLPVHPTGELLQGWAPGGSDLYFSPDIGTEMLGSNGYTLEMHYNSSDFSAADASGVEICVTPNKPTNVITRSWLGTDAILGSTSASGTCTPSSGERIHIVLGTPHMHLTGRHMKVVVNRRSGMQEVVHDEAFAFENQRDYPEDIWLEPGESISTTCTFSAPAVFGQGTSQEMCYWFAMHYPAGALTDYGLVAGALHGANTCLGILGL